MADGWSADSRIKLGRITHVDPDNGKIKVGSYLSCSGEDMSIPCMGLSPMNKGAASWMRYMPREGDYVVYGLDNLNTPFPLCFVPFASAADPTPEDTAEKKGGTSGSTTGLDVLSPGYAVLRKFQQENLSGFLQFGVLKRGEWDMRSSGGSYIHGSDKGKLTFSANGAADLSLSRNRAEINVEAPLSTAQANNCLFRYGAVKRQGPLDTAPVLPGKVLQLLPPAAPDPMEWSIRLGNSFPVLNPVLALAPASITYEEKAGDIWSDDIAGALGKTVAAGTQQASSVIAAQPLRYMRAVHMGGSVLPVFQQAPAYPLIAHLFTIDALGNMETVVNPAATSIKLGPPAGLVAATALEVETFSATVNCTAGIELTSLTDTVRLDGMSIQFGGAATAIEPVVLGLKLQAALTAFATTMSGIFSAMSTTPTGLGPVLAAGPGVAACAALNSALPGTMSAKVKTE